MATITSAGAGAWSSTTPNAPWPSGIIPSAGDSVVLNHVVTFTGTDSIVLGDGSAVAGDFTGANVVLLINAAGKLKHVSGAGNGVIELKGNVKIADTANLVYASYASDGLGGSMGDGLELDGGIFRFNGVSGKRFGLEPWSASNNYRRLKTRNGAKICSVNGNGNGFIFGIGPMDFQDTLFQYMGGVGLSNYSIQLNLTGATEALAPANLIVRFYNVVFDNCGPIDSTSGMLNQVTWDWDQVSFLNGLSTYDLHITHTYTAALTTGLRTVNRCGFQRGVVANITALAGQPDNGWIWTSCIMGVWYSLLTNARCKTFSNNVYGALSPGDVPADSPTNCYVTTTRSGAGNEKVWNIYNSTLAVVTASDCIMEVADDTNIRSGADAGEFIQAGNTGETAGLNVDGSSFTRMIFVPAEDGTTFRVMEAAFLTNAGANPLGKITYSFCSGGCGPSWIGFGHTPANPDTPGTARVVWNDGLSVGLYSNANGTGAFNNNTGPASITGYVNVNSGSSAPVQAQYDDAMKAEDFNRNAIWLLRPSAPSAPTLCYSATTGFDIKQTAGDRTSMILAANYYLNPFLGRTADSPNYLGVLPGSRRIRTLGAFNGIALPTPDAAGRDTQFNNTVAALCAQQVGPGVNTNYSSGHASYVSGVTNAALLTWVRRDWQPTNPAIQTVATGAVAPGAVAWISAATTVGSKNFLIRVRGRGRIKITYPSGGGG